MAIHQAAAEGFDREASAYQNSRPTYHPLLVERFVRLYCAGPVLEIGAGTGIFTGQLAECGVGVVAVEPVEGMRKRLIQLLPDGDVRVGMAEELPVPDRCFDTVVAAQAFHWFNYQRALDEIERVLVPGGHLVTVWNASDGEASWLPAYRAIIDRYAGDTPRYADKRWRMAIDADPRFELVDEWQVDHPQMTDRRGIVERMLSTSFIAALPDSIKNSITSEVLATLRDIEEPFEFPYRAELQAWRYSGAVNGTTRPSVNGL